MIDKKRKGAETDLLMIVNLKQKIKKRKRMGFVRVETVITTFYDTQEDGKKGFINLF